MNNLYYAVLAAGLALSSNPLNAEALITENQLSDHYEVPSLLMPKPTTPQTKLVSKYISIEDQDRLNSISLMFRKMIYGEIDGISYGPDSEEVLFITELIQQDLEFILDHYEFYPENEMLQLALVQSTGNAHKPQVLNALRTNSNLTNLVFTKGWHFDAREILLAHWEQMSTNDYPAYSLPEAIADLQISSTYPMLKHWFIHGWSQSELDSILVKNSEIDYAAWTLEMWQFSKKSNIEDPWFQITSSTIAARQGHPEALKDAFTQLQAFEKHEEFDVGTLEFLTNEVQQIISDVKDFNPDAFINGEQLVDWDSSKKSFFVKY